MGEREINAVNATLLEVLKQSIDATAIYQGENIEIVFANDKMLHFWDKGREIIGLPIAQAVPELLGQPFEEILKQVWRTGQSYDAKNVPAQLNQNGELQTLYFDFNYQAILNAEGQTQWILHTTLEVSDRMAALVLLKQKEEREQEVLRVLQEKHDALVATENRLHQLVSSSPIAMTILRSRDLVIEIPNDKMLQIWNRTFEQVDGKKLLEVFPELEGQPFPEMLAGVFETGQPVRIKEIAVTIANTDGTDREIFVDFAYEPLYNNQGEVDSVMTSVVNITAIVEVRKQLEKKELTLQQLNEELEATNEEYQSANEELTALNEEYNAINEELNTTNEELGALNEEYAVVNEELKATSEQVYELSEQLKIANEGLRTDNADLTLQRDDLTESLKDLFSVFTDAPVAIGLLRNDDLVIDYANAALLKLWGKDERVLEKTLAEAIPELEGQPFLEILANVLKTGTPYHGSGQKASLEHQGELKDFYFNFTYKPLINEMGVADSILVVANDVTDQILAKLAVDDVLNRLRFAVEVGSLGSYELNIADQTMINNNYFRKHFGFDLEDQITINHVLKRLLPEHQQAFQNDLEKAIANKSLFEGEYQVLWPDGSRHWIRATGRATVDPDGNPLKVVGVTADITERKAFDQRKDDFLSIASHELKTPVTTLKANLQLLDRLKDKIENPMASKLIDNAVRTSEKLNVMIGDLLDINRFNEGQVKLNKAPFAIQELLGNCCGHVRLENKHELVSTGDDVIVFGDESRIEQVISNFVDNAVKYAPDSKKIYLSAVREGGFLKISVKDDGPGIRPEQLQNLFDRYWRADHSSVKYSGLGLGLFICAEIVRKHGGQIGVDSELGKGATFWFTLPI